MLGPEQLLWPDLVSVLVFSVLSLCGEGSRYYGYCKNDITLEPKECSA